MQPEAEFRSKQSVEEQAQAGGDGNAGSRTPDKALLQKELRRRFILQTVDSILPHFVAEHKTQHRSAPEIAHVATARALMFAEAAYEVLAAWEIKNG